MFLFNEWTEVPSRKSQRDSLNQPLEQYRGRIRNHGQCPVDEPLRQITIFSVQGTPRDRMTSDDKTIT